MSDRLEKLIRQWGQGGQAPLSTRLEGGEDCLSFEQANRVTSGVKPDETLREHLKACAYCRRLLARQLVNNIGTGPVRAARHGLRNTALPNAANEPFICHITHPPALRGKPRARELIPRSSWNAPADFL